jgi:hypothetical protein
VFQYYHPLISIDRLTFIVVIRTSYWL